MNDLEDADVIHLLNRLQYRAPSIDALWSPERREGPHHWRFSLLLPLALVAGLIAATGVVASANGWFAEFVSPGACVPNDPGCGTDFAQVAILVDHTNGVTAVNILAKRGLSRERLVAIAASVAEQQKTKRKVIYVLDDLPPGAMSAGFQAVPVSDDDAPLPPPAELIPYLQLTYDSGPQGLHETWP